jgi:hypothetical protein
MQNGGDGKRDRRLMGREERGGFSLNKVVQDQNV